MPPRDSLHRLRDILDATRAVRDFVAGMDEAQFRADRRTVDAVLRNLTVIGEAARHVPEEMRRRFPEVPWLDMADMRNVVVHEYFGVDAQILWHTATRDVPELERMVGAALEQAAPQVPGQADPGRPDG